MLYDKILVNIKTTEIFDDLFEDEKELVRDGYDGSVGHIDFENLITERLHSVGLTGLFTIEQEG